MKLSKVVIFLAFLGVLLLVLVRGQESSEVYCGRRLAITLAVICSDKGMLEKRAESPQYNALMPHEQYTWPWIAPYRAKSLQRGKRYQEIAAECCEKPCTINEMMSYCRSS